MRDATLRRAVAVLVAAGLALAWYRTRHPAGPLPSTDSDAVAAMVVEDETTPGWPAHAVDPADYARVLRLFEGGVRDESPATWVSVGRVVIADRGGRTYSVRLFRTDGGPGAYRVHGHGYYRGSSDAEIAATLAACRPGTATRPGE